MEKKGKVQKKMSSFYFPSHIVQYIQYINKHILYIYKDKHCIICG